METSDLLLEIGTEEIPASYVRAAAAELRRRLIRLLTENGIAFAAEPAEELCTPRRLAVLLHGIARQQTTRTEMKLGPAVAAAFDAAGEPTAAARGFARSLGVAVEALEVVSTDRGERLGRSVEVGGATTRSILEREGLLRELLHLGFPKTMRWMVGDAFAFARPIRWLVCLLGEEVVPIRLAHLVAGRTSRGHRTLSPGPVEILRARDYVQVLAAAHVQVRPTERQRVIQAAAERLAQEAGGRLHAAEDLLEEVTFLCEHPHPVLGRYEPRFVEVLPPEVIITAMRAHQRYFSVEDESGRLVPRFITFRDGGDAALANVVEGNERVLRARLDDALFYWNEDRSLSSEAKLERLARIVWLEGLGTLREKCSRIHDLALKLRQRLAPDLDADPLARAALLCKTDLATEMIRDGKEFTKLQGTIGRYYALQAGEDPVVAAAIEEHLFPRFATDRLPADPVSTLVALADRLDSIAGCTLAGFAPTGSQDPYALRRQAFAILRILEDRAWNLDLTPWIERALEGFPRSAAERATAAATVEDLFWGRLETRLSDLPAEIVRAVLSVQPLDPVETVRAARALASLASDPSFAMLLIGAKRCRNILVKEQRLEEETQEEHTRAHLLQKRARERWEAWKAFSKLGSSLPAVGAAPTHGGGPALGFDAGRLIEPAERDLLATVVDAVPRLDAARADGDHEIVYRTLASLGGPISRYFDEVLVNCPDEELRRNRLLFLEDIHYLFARFADLSRVPSV